MIPHAAATQKYILQFIFFFSAPGDVADATPIGKPTHAEPNLRSNLSRGCKPTDISQASQASHVGQVTGLAPGALRNKRPRARTIVLILCSHNLGP